MTKVVDCKERVKRDLSMWKMYLIVELSVILL